MIDFGILPPEITSSLIYSGPGAGPLLEAATAWESLASNLSAGQVQYASVIGSLDGAWLGASATAMQTSATRYLSWMTQTAAMAELTANQARAASAAYGVAKAATVPPAVIAANRAQLNALIATNFLGVNTPAILATEAEYVEFWAQDAEAMYAYQAASQAATSSLPKFQPAPQTTTGTTPQGITQPAASSGGWNIFAPGSNTDTTGLSGLLNLWSGQTDSAFGSFVNSSFLNTVGSSAIFNPGETYAPLAALAALLPAFQQMGQSMESQGVSGGAVGEPVVSVGGGFAGGQVSAALGQAPKAGALSVPQGFQNATRSSLVEPVGTTPLRPVQGAGMVPLGMPVGSKSKDSQQQPRYGFPIKVVNSHPAGG